MTENSKNIILIGRTGSGKSTLANVLVNKDGNFEEVFPADSNSVSVTKEVQVEEWEENNTKYRLIDTVSINHTKLNSQEVNEKWQEACRKAEGGITQILLLYEGIFGKSEKELYELLMSADDDIAKYITIVQTNYVDFESEEECEKSSRELQKSLTKSCNKIIWVDNPPLRGRSAEFNKETRTISRQKLLNHLATCQGTYDPVNLAKLDFATEEEKIKQQTKELRKKIQKENPKDKFFGGIVIFLVIFIIYLLIRKYFF